MENCSVRTLGLPFYLAVKRCGNRFTRDALAVSIASQRMVHYRLQPDWRMPCPLPYLPARQFRISTSRFGIGQVEGSNRTPLGLHRVAKKIGGGWPVP